MIRGLVWWRVMAIPFLQFSSKKQASDWCHGGVVIVYVYLLWGQPARGLRFWGILGYNGIASTLNLPSHQNFSVWSSLVKPLRARSTTLEPRAGCTIYHSVCCMGDSACFVQSRLILLVSTVVISWLGQSRMHSHSCYSS